MSPNKNLGVPPGTIIYTGDRISGYTRYTLVEYDELSCEIFSGTDFENIKPFILRNPEKTYWLNIDGIHQVHVLEDVGKFFQIHPLTLEDIASVTQRAKIEEYENYIYAVLKLIDVKEEKLYVEQLSFVLSRGIVITFQEDTEVNDLENILVRIEQAKGKIRKMKEDYLFYALIDSVVDSYFHVAEFISDRLENLEDLIFEDDHRKTLTLIYESKKEILYVKKMLWPVRDMMTAIIRTEHVLLGKNIRLYFRDVQDHMYRILEAIENDHKLINSILQVYLSRNAHRLNEIMKVLTLVSTLFIPVTFLVGVYGMNFDYMPELRWKYGYFIIWAIILGVIGFQIYYFKKKKWI